MVLRLDLISILGAAFILGSNYAFVRAGGIDERRYRRSYDTYADLKRCVSTYVCICQLCA